MIKKGFLLILATTITFLLIGCGAEEQKSSLGEEGIKITNMVSSMGGVKGEENNFNKQRYSYNLTLHNYDDNNFFINSVEPILGDKIKDRVVEKDIKVLVNSEIKSKQSLKVSGEIIIYTENLSKEEIDALEPYIKEFKITEERVVKLENRKTNDLAK